MPTTATGFRLTVMQGGSVCLEQGGFTVVLSKADAQNLIECLARCGDYAELFDRLAIEHGISEWVMPDHTVAVVGAAELPARECAVCHQPSTDLVVYDDRLMCRRCLR